jgi:hypothetical protein
MFTSSDPLEYFKFQYGRSTTGKNFKSTVINKYPALSYRFGENGNWLIDDLRFRSNEKEALEWLKNYWRSRPAGSLVNGEAYEYDLEQAVLKAYDEVNEKWNKKLEREFEERFDDRLLGFMSGEKQNK